MGRVITIADENVKETILEVLAAGKPLIMPCDTIYGIVGRVPESEESIRALKGRDRDKPFIELITLEMLFNLTSQEIPVSWKSLWPGPLTLIVRRKSGDGTVALRVPSDPLLTSLIRETGSPLYSSSVNITGEESLHNFEDILFAFSDSVPLCVRGGDLQGTVASTIVDLSGASPRLLRSGALDVSPLL